MMMRLIYFWPIIFYLNSGCHEVLLKDFSGLDIKYQYVNLKSATARKEKMDEQLKLAAVNFSAIDAILGKSLREDELNKLVTNGIYDAHSYNNKALTPAELGVYLSTIQKALPQAINNKDTITVTFEDDVVIPYDVETQFKQALSAVPDDWDILYLGCYMNYLTKRSGDMIGPYMPVVTPEAQAFPYNLCAPADTNRVYNTPWIKIDAGCVAGMYAYALSSASAQKLRTKLIPIKQAVDRQITNLVGAGTIKAYCLSPELIRVNTTIPSTIR